MSKTDKTKPFWVRRLEHSPRELHDHRNGVCDIEKVFDLDYWVRYQCDLGYWWPGCCNGCGCRICTDYWGRRWTRRRDRHVARKHIRNQDWDQLGSRVRQSY